MTGTPQQRNRRLAGWLAGAAAAMLGLAFASAPLYGLFCRVTGFGGATQRAAAAPGPSSGPGGARIIAVRFNADVHSGLPWRFEPTEPVLRLRPGEPGLTAYRARNLGAGPSAGVASYNVTPDKMGKYFSKVACFCFEGQGLAAGQQADLPLAFFIDPAMTDDPAMADVTTVTLSYTFFRARDEAAILARLH